MIVSYVTYGESDDLRGTTTLVSAVSDNEAVVVSSEITTELDVDGYPILNIPIKDGATPGATATITTFYDEHEGPSFVVTVADVTYTYKITSSGGTDYTNGSYNLYKGGSETFTASVSGSDGSVPAGSWSWGINDNFTNGGYEASSSSNTLTVSRPVGDPFGAEEFTFTATFTPDDGSGPTSLNMNIYTAN